jgi:integrase
MGRNSEIRDKRLGALSRRLDCEIARRAHQHGRSGWHSFRHYSTLLNEYGTDIKVQQELLRHADIRTTMNIYTRAVPARLREANSKVVRLLLPTGT